MKEGLKLHGLIETYYDIYMNTINSNVISVTDMLCQPRPLLTRERFDLDVDCIRLESKMKKP